MTWLTVASIIESYNLHQTLRLQRALIAAAVFSNRKLCQTEAVFLEDRLFARVPLRMAKQQIQGANRSPCSPQTTVARVRPVTRKKFIFLHPYFDLPSYF